MVKKHGVAKLAVLHLLKAVGAFTFARRITRRGLRILCYHAWSEGDEHLYNPIVFMRAETFRRRMVMLRRRGYPVVSFDQGMSGNYPDCATVITIDDGWRSTATIAAPILQEFGCPATLYVSTYYVEKGTQVFNMLVRYVLWKTKANRLALPQWALDIDLSDRHIAAEDIFARASTLDASQRQELAEAISKALGVETAGRFRYVDQKELQALPQTGIDLQLHTHRHRSDDLMREIADNRRVLDLFATRPLVHFCYPSGHCAPKRLRELDISTATTAEPGLCFKHTHALMIPRFLDSDYLTDIEVEAELCGLLTLARNPKLLISRRRRVSHPATDHLASPTVLNRATSGGTCASR